MLQRDSTKIEMWGGRCGVSTTSLYVVSVSVLGCIHTKYNAAAKIFHDTSCVHVTLRLPITCLSNPTQMHHSKLRDSTVVLIPCYGYYVRTPRPLPGTQLVRNPARFRHSVRFGVNAALIRAVGSKAFYYVPEAWQLSRFFLIVFDKYILITFSWQECSKKRHNILQFCFMTHY